MTGAEVRQVCGREERDSDWCNAQNDDDDTLVRVVMNGEEDTKAIVWKESLTLVLPR